ncbi:MAG: DNA-processing protein DprA [Elusimicrobia bacterium]|nr:DNA-processing protein DprA [Candidatus Obscuribacterium magneticum]
MNDQSEVCSTVFLNLLEEIGPARFQELLRHFGSAQKAVGAGPESWQEPLRLGVEILQQMRSVFDSTRRLADREMERIQKEGVTVLLWQGEGYPPLLREIIDAPPIIYVKGNAELLGEPAIALVGSRRCSYYGETMARRLTSDLVEAGLVTGSGFARGIDSHVHRETLTRNGHTWAVLGSGLSVIYPPENEHLSKDIEKSGALLSEFPMETPPLPGHFPRRNRIIAGLSLGTVVVEGQEKSGALITARLAAEYGREVFAVPGPATSLLSVGPNRLIQMGAKMVLSVNDILEELSLEHTSVSGVETGSTTETPGEVPAPFREILSSLEGSPVNREALAGRLGIDPQVLSAVLLTMELKGWLRSLPGGLVAKT